MIAQLAGVTQNRAMVSAQLAVVFQNLAEMYLYLRMGRNIFELKKTLDCLSYLLCLRRPGALLKNRPWTPQNFLYVPPCAPRFALRSTLYIKPVGKFYQEYIVGFHFK
jgi:hypothetical protein